MRIIATEQLLGRDVTDFGSHGFAVFPAARAAHVVIASLKPDGIIGRHLAAVDQLLVVLSGEVLVEGDEREQERVGAGSGALWIAGESHSTRALSDVRVVIIEAQGLAATFDYLTS